MKIKKPYTERLIILATEKQKEDLKKEAEAKGMTLSELLRDRIFNNG